MKLALQLSSLVPASLLPLAVLAAGCTQLFATRLVSFEFVPAESGESVPGRDRYPGEDALAIRFESDKDLVELSNHHPLQFWCTIEGSQLQDVDLFGLIYYDPADPRWTDEITARYPRRYLARVRLWPGEMMRNRSTFYRQQFLSGTYDRLTCQLSSVPMGPGVAYYSTKMVVPVAAVKRAIADALDKQSR